ncbi:MAG: aminotransferase class III-fold pyridoxal phosphate-dependent enzyme, partial [Pseudomonadota bacterium]
SVWIIRRKLIDARPFGTALVAMANQNPFIERYAKAFGRPQATLLKITGLSSAEVSGERHLVRTADGQEWTDFGSFGVHLLGHNHPEVKRAISQASEELGLSTRILGNLAATELAEVLASSVPWELDSVMMANSGSEAVEIALRMSMIATGRTKVLCLKGGYHGKSFATSVLSGAYASDRIPVCLEVTKVSAGDYGALRTALQTEAFATFIAEPVQGEGGIVPVDTDFLSLAAELCGQTGTKFVLDEIQTGLGRTGVSWAGCGVTTGVDAVLTGKVLGGGYVPIAAAIFDSKSFGSQATDPILHSSSFSGGTLAARVAIAAVNTATNKAFLNRVNELSILAQDCFDKWADQATFPIAFRRHGLMMGIELDSPERAGQFIIEAIKENLLLTFCLANPRVIRIYPPGVISDGEMDNALDRLGKALARVETLR